MRRVHKHSSYNSTRSAVAILRDFTNHLEDMRKVKRKLPNNTY